MQLKHHIKASVKLMTFVRENQIIPWQGVYFFTNTVFMLCFEIFTKMEQCYSPSLVTKELSEMLKSVVTICKGQLNKIGCLIG